jgi:mRNA-degrading endonuclease RelE of RelBE toxin-antitoxin system
MSFRVVIHPDLATVCRKLRAKSPGRYEQLKKKIRSPAKNPESGKPLHPPLRGLWRAHIGHLVLFYAIRENTVVFLSLVPHDEAYRR